MITHRPCGACRALVPVVSGCKHWRVKPEPKSRGKTESARRNKLAYDRKYHHNLTPEQREAKRARDREYARVARERAAAAVERFRSNDGKE